MAANGTTDLLEQLNAQVLNALARKLGVPKTTTRKPELILALEEIIRRDPRRILDRLSDTETKLLAEAAHNDGLVDAVRFAAKYGVACPIPSAHMYPPSDASPLVLLIGHEYGSRRLPAGVAEALRKILPKPAEATVAVTETLPATYVPPKSWRQVPERPVHVYESERIVFPELRSVLKLVQAGKLKVTDKGGRPTEDSVRLISEVLVVPDFLLEPPAEQIRQYTERAGAVRGHAWGVLVQQCGWAKARGGRLALTDTGQRLLTSCAAPDLAAGVERLLNDDEFDELNRINHIRGQSGGGRRHLTAPGERRSPICDSMADWPVNRWITFAEADRFIRAGGCQFEVTDADDTLYFCELQYGGLGCRGAEINRQYLRAFLFESLATLGLIDVAYVYPHHLWPELGDCWGRDDLSFCGRYDGLLYVRLNALGAYCLRVADSYEPVVAPAAGSLRVLPNREVALLDSRNLSPADRHVLELFAAPKSEYVWELDTTRILTHLESGGSVDELLRYLESNTSDPIPETVQVMLSDLAARTTAIQGVEDAFLLELKDEAIAALIAHDTQAGKCCHLAGTRHIAVPKKNQRAFRNAVKKLGFVIPNDSMR